jgi:deazaflavin-dependent oxidoreductase (nitroreductase family)
VILIASSWGRDKHPAWYYNVRAHPEDVRLGKAGGGPRFRASEITEPAERKRVWQMADRVYPGYAHYRKLAAAANREIPMFRLVRM